VSVEVTAVRGARQLGAFIGLPFRLHANHPLWVPPLKLERRLFLSKRMNAFFTHGEGEYFLARRDGRVVGRITAHVNHAFNEHHGARWGWFGFIEFEQDAEVLQALLSAAEAWLREHGCERMLGPASFALNDEGGMLVEGFDLRPMILQPWNPPWYPQMMEQAGMTKAMDLLMWNLEVTNRDQVLPVIWELAEKSRTEHGIRIRPMRRRQLRKDLDFFGAVYNEAWANNWDFVPYSKADLDAYHLDLQLAYDKSWFMIAEKQDTGEVVGMAITVPDLNQVLEQMKGRLLPLGWWKFLTKSKRMDRVRVGFLGVKPEHQHTGVAAALYEAHYDAAERTPQKGGEMGWILETNTPMNRGMEAMGGKVVKRYRVYERALHGGSTAGDGGDGAAESPAAGGTDAEA
jgi:GNAT superfamily N-acetyltransferase